MCLSGRSPGQELHGASGASASVVLPEFLEAFGVGPPEIREGRKRGERLWAEVVFDVLDLILDGLGLEAHQGEEFGEGAMPVLDVGGDLAALFGERESPVALVVHEAASGEATDHVGDGGSAEAEGFGEVGDPGVSDAFNEFLDPFEVILGGFGACIACMAGDPGHGWMMA